MVGRYSVYSRNTVAWTVSGSQLQHKHLMLASCVVICFLTLFKLQYFANTRNIYLPTYRWNPLDLNFTLESKYDDSHKNLSSEKQKINIGVFSPFWTKKWLRRKCNIQMIITFDPLNQIWIRKKWAVAYCLKIGTKLFSWRDSIVYMI